MTVDLLEHQQEAIERLDSGKILWGGVGTGKSLTVVGYYVSKESPKDLYIITTAKKRDSLDWEGEAAKFGISTEAELSRGGKLTVDSWNNIKKYEGIEDAFFVFDEQRVVGNGAWVKSFLKITKRNRWVLLSATPGDTWMDYIPVFVANGFYKNATDFKLRHVIYEPYTKFPKVRGYRGENRLEIYRNEVLVEMPYDTHTKRMVNYIDCEYDQGLYKRVVRDRWNVYTNEPIKDVSEMFRTVRRVVNSDPSRLEFIKKLLVCHPKLIIFYNFNYELEILRTLKENTWVGEWNGHKKDPIPFADTWVYLVQYVAGAEGWNCIETNAIVMYSMTYSYKNFMQAQGRIDRLNTKFTDLYYYILSSYSGIDEAIRNALGEKRSFNEQNYLSERGENSVPEEIFKI